MKEDKIIVWKKISLVTLIYLVKGLLFREFLKLNYVKCYILCFYDQSLNVGYCKFTDIHFRYAKRLDFGSAFYRHSGNVYILF